MLMAFTMESYRLRAVFCWEEFYYDSASGIYGWNREGFS